MCFTVFKMIINLNIAINILTLVFCGTYMYYTCTTCFTKSETCYVFKQFLQIWNDINNFRYDQFQKGLQC